MKETIDCRIPIKFSIKPDINGMYFTKESLRNIEKYLNHVPIIHNEKVIGVLSNSFYKIENDEEITLFVDGKLFKKCYSEISVLEREGNIIKKFKFMGINI